MKIICSQSDLKSQLSLVSRIVPSRPTHPILANILIETDADSKMWLTGFDLSLGIKTNLDAHIEKEGRLTVPAKLMNDIVSRLPEGDLTLILNENNNDDILLEIQSNSGNFHIRGLAANDYPELPRIKDGETFILPKETLSEGLNYTVFSASDDDTKQALTGVHFIAKEDTLEFAATDGHRLSVFKTSADTEDANSILNNFQATIPAKALKEVQKMIDNASSYDSLAMCIEDNQVIFKIGQNSLITRIIDSAYPAYNQLIPTEFKHKLIVDRKRLLNALELVAGLSDQKNNIVKFVIDAEEGQLVLSVDARETGNAKQKMSAEIIGDSSQIGFNVKYLIEGLKAIPSEEVQIKLNDPHQPVIFSPLNEREMTYLVMPVQLRE